MANFPFNKQKQAPILDSTGAPAWQEASGPSEGTKPEAPPTAAGPQSSYADGAKYINREAFEHHARLIEQGDAVITFEMLGDIFGKEFWMILIMSLMDAQTAARAIQLAMSQMIVKLSGGGPKQ